VGLGERRALREMALWTASGAGASEAPPAMRQRSSNAIALILTLVPCEPPLGCGARRNQKDGPWSKTNNRTNSGVCQVVWARGRKLALELAFWHVAGPREVEGRLGPITNSWFRKFAKPFLP
jgi:hypothetical protein